MLARLVNGTSKKTGSPSRMRKRKIKTTNPMLDNPSTRIRASTENSPHRLRGLASSMANVSAVHFVQPGLSLQWYKSQLGHERLALAEHPIHVLGHLASGHASRVHVQ